MKTIQAARQHRRLPGEIAFDRCFFPVAVLFVLFVVYRITTIRSYPTLEALIDAASPGWHVWVPFGLGLILAIFWYRAVVSLIRAWRDPSSRILRISASVLLIPFSVATVRLLVAPFQ